MSQTPPPPSISQLQRKNSFLSSTPSMSAPLFMRNCSVVLKRLTNQELAKHCRKSTISSIKLQESCSLDVVESPITLEDDKGKDNKIPKPNFLKLLHLEPKPTHLSMPECSVILTRSTKKEVMKYCGKPADPSLAPEESVGMNILNESSMPSCSVVLKRLTSKEIMEHCRRPLDSSLVPQESDSVSIPSELNRQNSSVGLQNLPGEADTSDS